MTMNLVHAVLIRRHDACESGSGFVAAVVIILSKRRAEVDRSYQIPSIAAVLLAPTA